MFADLLILGRGQTPVALSYRHFVSQGNLVLQLGGTPQVHIGLAEHVRIGSQQLLALPNLLGGEIRPHDLGQV